MDNYAIADNFSLLAKLMDIHGENSFKSKTYSIAAFNIEKLPVQLKDTPRDKIFSLKGIGESVGKKVVEMLDTGGSTVLAEYIQNTPPGIVEMMNIKGLGPKKINMIWKELEIESIGELLYACNENRLLHYKGFGEKTQNNVRDAIEFYLQNQGSYLYSQIESYAFAMDKKLKEHFPDHKIEHSGAFRRQMETIDILEWCTTIPKEQLKKFFEESQFELVEEAGDSIIYNAPENVKLKFYISDKANFYSNLFNTSCSADFLNGWSNSTQPMKEVDFENEESIFASAGIDYISAFLRENESILTKAKEKKLPQLIQPSDIRAIIHSHSNWSDGVNTIEEMAVECVKRGYEYLVISDHSKSAFYANGLSEVRIREQHNYIDELNEKFKTQAMESLAESRGQNSGSKQAFRIFKSIECDILNDGSLDYSNEILSTFDLVIASVHSNLKMTEEKAMGRVLKAISNPFVTILGHMTGRLLLSRNGYPLDHKTIIATCAANNVVIELNAHPRRLDIDWRWIDFALESGALLSIDPDAHSVEGFNDVRYGVLAAQKGGLTKEKNLSSFTLKEFENYLEARKK